jgi:2,3-bisphosphoglycerate-independent phosphoglycerate mutase
VVTASLLLVPDGASEPLGARPTSLEEARTPVLDGLAASGTLARVRTIPEGLPAGTEVGLATLLGVELPDAPSRGRIEAAAAGIPLGPEEGAWRLDVLDGHRPADIGDDDVASLDHALSQLGGRVHRLRGHRLLLVGPAWWGDAPPGPHQTDLPLRALAIGPFGGVAKAARTALGGRPVAWPWGMLGSRFPESNGRPVLVVAQSSGAVGVARLLGYPVIAEVPDPLPDDALVVVHVADPDEAAHGRDRPGKIAALERFDALVGELLTHEAHVMVCPDHGCDPATGRHTAEPVPALLSRPGGGAPGFTERAAAGRPLLSETLP